MTSVLPEHALLLRDFANTVGVEDDTDALTEPAALTTWLRVRGLIPGRAGGAGDAGSKSACDADETDLEMAIALRTSLRAAMRAHHQRPPGASGLTSGLETAAASLPLRVTVSAGHPALVPVDGGVRGGLARLAAAMVASTADRSWERLKICAEDSCQWAFLDSSKNRSKHWCSMQECGNRSKTRAYRARRATGGSGQ